MLSWSRPRVLEVSSGGDGRLLVHFGGADVVLSHFLVNFSQLH